MSVFNSWPREAPCLSACLQCDMMPLMNGGRAEANINTLLLSKGLLVSEERQGASKMPAELRPGPCRGLRVDRRAVDANVRSVAREQLRDACPARQPVRPAAATPRAPFIINSDTQTIAAERSEVTLRGVRRRT